MAAVTMPQLRSLARLYRDGIEGAAEQLDAHIEHRAEQLAEVIGFPPDEIPRLRDCTDRVDLIVRTIEKAGAHHRQLRQRSARKQAEALVLTLLDGAERIDADVVDVSPAALDDLVACGGYDWLTFDSEFVIRGIPRGLLRAFFRECRGVAVNSARIGSDLLVLCYAGPHSRGVLRLAFHHVPRGANAVCVPLEHVRLRAHEPALVRAAESSTPAQIEPVTPRREAEAASDEPEPAPPTTARSSNSASSTPRSERTQARAAPCRSRTRTVGFLRHLVDAIVESL